MNDLNYLLKGGRWEYNIHENRIICRNQKGVNYIFEECENSLWNEILSTLDKIGKPNHKLTITWRKPEAEIPLELFHRILRSNEVIYEQAVAIRQDSTGLYCFSEYTKNFQLNHHEYSEQVTVQVDPQQVCKITRRIRDRERVHTKLSLENKRIILLCEFPWTKLTIILPTVKRQ